MAVNLKKNKEQLLAAFNEVLSDSNSTNWVVFGYEGKTYDLTVIEKGDGEIDELVDEMNSGRVLYALIRVKDPNTQLLKNVWINWSGEGVPSSVKGVCANHVSDVSRFFRGAHVTINARSEEDLDEDTILDKVSKSSGSNYSIHKEKAKSYAPQGNIGSVYKKTDAQSEIRSGKKDDFWTKQEREEESRRRQEVEDQKRRRAEEESERKQRDIAAARDRERAAEERFKSIQQQKQQEHEEERRRRQERESEERSRMQQVVGEIDAEKMREQREAESRRLQERSAIGAAVRDRKSGDVFQDTGPSSRPTMPERPRPEPEPEPEPYIPQQEPDYEFDPEPYPEPEPEPYPEPEPEPYPEPEPEPYPEPEPEPYQEPEPEPEPYQETEEPEAYYEEGQQGYDQEDYAGEEQEPPAEQGEVINARAIYDYQAAGEDEISFDPGEIITNIEKIDEGWWMGTNPRGETGLFPSNYVEEI